MFHIRKWLFDFSFVVFLCYLDSFGHFLRSYGGHFFPWILPKGLSCAQNDSLQLESQGILSPSSLKFVCGRETCPKTIFPFCSSFDSHFCLFRCIVPFPCCSITESGYFFHLLSFFCYLDSVCQFMGSYAGLFLVSDSVKKSYLAPTNGEPSTQNTRTPVSIICRVCLWKGDLSKNYIFFLFFFWFTLFVFSDVLSRFHIVSYRNLTVWFFICCLFLCYLNSVYQLLGSYRSLFLVPDSVKWAFLRPQTESLLLEPRGFLFPSSANLVCRRETCPEAIFTFFFFFWPTLFVF